MKHPLPPALPEVVALAVESLTTRLRGRLDAAVGALAGTEVTAEAGTLRVRCGEDTWVTLTPDPSGALSEAGHVDCTCLLAPRCLHRAAVLTSCPVADTKRHPPAPAPPAGHASAAAPAAALAAVPATASAGPSAEQVRAASGLWAAAASVLSAGTGGAGAVLRAELLRAAHTARLAGLHRAEAAALDVVCQVRDEHDPHRPRALAASVAALRELLLVTHRLRTSDPDPALIGTVRRLHRPDGPLRLYGVCREPVIGPDGLGGVVTHLVDDDGHWYTLPDVKPGGPARARRAGDAHVALRTFLSDHFRLSRGGLVLTGAAVAPDGRLLPEPGVRATFAAGRPWAVTARVAPAGGERFPAPPAPGSDGAGPAGPAGPLTVRDLEVAGADGQDLLARVLPEPDDRVLPEPDGGLVRLTPAHRHPGLEHTANLRRLGARPGLRIRVAGRVEPDRVSVLRPLAVAPVPGTGATLRLPHAWQGRADLGYDTLHDDHFPPDLPALPCGPAPSGADAPTGDSPLWRMRALVELAVAGGRRAAAEPARDGVHPEHAAALHRAGFVNGARLAAALGAVAAHRTRDAFGRLDDGGPDRYAAQWLATAVYLDGTEAALRRASWHEYPAPEANG
ncbi:hypothetical protein HTV45_26215 [Streptomyces sp. CHD11]|uniref:hypothetical protein n=1 Tax=Streptomyces sp. CHD11 TaxID=2741325 RepID=UPI001BFC9122|nr:hypothetical protein [Streptomyces sp. CHD11]MBT3154326.1 hypothetical protein [Streptomyces sp. CHD11]